MAKFIRRTSSFQGAAALENGGDTGSRGWNYRFDRDFTRRLILRSWVNGASAWQLPTPRFRASIRQLFAASVRKGRRDHLSDFYQTEGIVWAKM
jgi:phenylalanyl-tRNA synthetase alpha chain